MEDVCPLCNEAKELHLHHGTKQRVCTSCYNGKLRAAHPCHFCHEEKLVEMWLTPEKPVCKGCYRSHCLLERCSICRRRKHVHIRTDDGQPICGRCYRKFVNLAVCSECGEKAEVQLNLDGKTPVCPACCRKRKKQPCGHCSVSRVLIGEVDGKPCCAPCRRKRCPGVCVVCGDEKQLYARNRCSACYKVFLREQLSAKRRLLTIGTIVYFLRTKQLGKVIGSRTPLRGRTEASRLRKTDLMIAVLNGKKTDGEVLWPLRLCRSVDPSVEGRVAAVASA